MNMYADAGIKIDDAGGGDDAGGHGVMPHRQAQELLRLQLPDGCRID